MKPSIVLSLLARGGSGSGISRRWTLCRLQIRLGNLPALQIGQAASLIVNVADLLVRLDVELSHLPTGRRVECLLEVRVQTAPVVHSLVGDLVLLVKTLGPVGGTVLFVEVGKSGREARGEAVLVVQRDGLLDRLVADHIAVSQILSDDAGSRLVLLINVVLVLILGFGGAGHVRTRNLINSVCRFDMHGRRSQLRVVEKKSSLCSPTHGLVSIVIIESDKRKQNSRFLLKGDSRRLGSVRLGRGRSHSQVGDLSTANKSASGHDRTITQLNKRQPYQKLKKSRTSFSVTEEAIPETWTTVLPVIVTEFD